MLNSNDQHRYHGRAVLWLRFMHLLPCIVVEIKYYMILCTCSYVFVHLPSNVLIQLDECSIF